MRQWLTRFLLAGWFIGMVAVGIWNGQQTAASPRGGNAVFMPLIQKNSVDLRGYVGIARRCSAQAECTDGGLTRFYTVRADGSEWSPLIEEAYAAPFAWSPDGAHLAYAQPSVTSPGQIDMMVMALPSRTTHLLTTTDRHWVPRWSPNSRYLLLFGRTEYRIWDVETETMTSYGLPSAIEPPRPGQIYWRADSQQFAWISGASYEEQSVWVWLGFGNGPRLVHHSATGIDTLYWSTDGNRLLFNVYNGVTFDDDLYESNAAGDPAFLFMENFVMKGWLGNGTVLTLVRDNKVYLALADGSALTLFSEDAYVYGYRVSPSPRGNLVAMESLDGLLMRYTDFSPAVVLPGCGDHYWNSDGSQFICTLGDDKFHVVDASTLTMREVRLSDTYELSQIMDVSGNLLALNRFTYRFDPYPHHYFEESYLLDLVVGHTKTIGSPEMYRRFRVMEWRQMP